MVQVHYLYGLCHTKRSLMSRVSVHLFFCPPPHEMRKGKYWIRHHLSIRPFASNDSKSFCQNLMIWHPGIPHGAFGHWSQDGHIDLLFGLLYSGPRMSRAITQKIPLDSHQTTCLDSSHKYLARVHSGAILTYFLTYFTPGLKCPLAR